MASNGTIVLNNATGGAVSVAGSEASRSYTVKSTYYVERVNPDLKVYLLIGTNRFLVAPGVTPITHTANGTNVAYEFTLLAGAAVTVEWEIS